MAGEIHDDAFGPELRSLKRDNQNLGAVSYTHLTLPTKRIV